MLYVLRSYTRKRNNVHEDFHTQHLTISLVPYKIYCNTVLISVSCNSCSLHRSQRDSNRSQSVQILIEGGCRFLHDIVDIDHRVQKLRCCYEGGCRSSARHRRHWPQSSEVQKLRCCYSGPPHVSLCHYLQQQESFLILWIPLAWIGLVVAAGPTDVANRNGYFH